MAFDRFFKLALLTVLLGILWIAWATSGNGRYIYHAETEHDKSVIIDSRTGATFMFVFQNNGSVLEFRPQTGETVRHWFWSQPARAAHKAMPEPAPER